MNENICNSKQKWNHDEYRCDWKESDICSSFKNDCLWYPSRCDYRCSKICKIDEYLDIKNCSCEKPLLGKLVLTCEDEILITTETSLFEKKVTCEKKKKKKIALFTLFQW